MMAIIKNKLLSARFCIYKKEDLIIERQMKLKKLEVVPCLNQGCCMASFIQIRLAGSWSSSLRKRSIIN
jgi:hypothetical protein